MIPLYYIAANDDDGQTWELLVQARSQQEALLLWWQHFDGAVWDRDALRPVPTAEDDGWDGTIRLIPLAPDSYGALDWGKMPATGFRLMEVPT